MPTSVPKQCGADFRVLGFRVVLGLGFGVEGRSGFRGLGFRVWG